MDPPCPAAGVTNDRVDAALTNRDVAPARPLSETGPGLAEGRCPRPGPLLGILVGITLGLCLWALLGFAAVRLL